MGSCSSSSSAALVTPRAAIATATPAPEAPLPRVLGEAEAWTIAVTWCPELQGGVRLVSDDEPVPLSIVPSFEWVQFDYGVGNPNPVGMAAYARAATITWFALSSCEGYSGTENPQFWRRVFLEYRYPGYMIQQLHAARLSVGEELLLSESARFFDKPDHPFPRVKIQSSPVGEDTLAETTFLGRHKYDDKALEKTLKRLLTKLKPFIRADHWARSVPVSIGNVHVTKLETVLENTAQRAPEETTACPRFRLVSVGLQDAEALGSERLLTNLAQYDVDIDIPRKREIDKTIFRRHSEDLHTRWWIRCLRLHGSLRGDMKALFSALPQLQTVQNVDIGAPLVRPRPLADWKWLGYAIFHPDTRSESSLVSLDLDVGEISRADTMAIQSMALGNQLRDVADNTTSSTYIDGRIGAPTNVWTENVWTEPGAADAWIQSILPPDQWITLCVSSEEALAANPEWICIINPGFGFGWIRRDALVEVRSRPPSKSCIRALRIHHAVDQVVVLSLLELLGAELTTLEIVDGPAESAEALQRILLRCPSLKSLRVRHDGTLWATPQLAMAAPCLEELQLQTGNSVFQKVELQQLSAKCLPHLKALRIISANADSFARDQAIFAAFLTEQRVLHYLHWVREYDSSHQVSTNSYRRPHLATQHFRRVMKEKALDVADQPFQKDGLLAFLSVIRRVSMQEHDSELTPLGLFGSDIVLVISQFTTSPLRRDITIDL